MKAVLVTVGSIILFVAGVVLFLLISAGLPHASDMRGAVWSLWAIFALVGFIGGFGLLGLGVLLDQLQKRNKAA